MLQLQCMFADIRILRTDFSHSIMDPNELILQIVENWEFPNLLSFGFEDLRRRGNLTNNEPLACALASCDTMRKLQHVKCCTCILESEDVLLVIENFPELKTFEVCMTDSEWSILQLVDNINIDQLVCRRFPLCTSTTYSPLS